MVTIGSLPTIAGMIGGFLMASSAASRRLRAHCDDSRRRRDGCAARRSYSTDRSGSGTSVAGVRIAALMPTVLATLLPYTLVPFLTNGFADESTRRFRGR